MIMYLVGLHGVPTLAGPRQNNGSEKGATPTSTGTGTSPKVSAAIPNADPSPNTNATLVDNFAATVQLTDNTSVSLYIGANQSIYRYVRVCFFRVLASRDWVLVPSSKWSWSVNQSGQHIIASSWFRVTPAAELPLIGPRVVVVVVLPLTPAFCLCPQVWRRVGGYWVAMARGSGNNRLEQRIRRLDSGRIFLAEGHVGRPRSGLSTAVQFVSGAQMEAICTQRELGHSFSKWRQQIQG